MSNSHHYGTRAIHVGSEPDPTTGAVVPAISLATTYAQKALGEKYGVESANSFGEGFEYSRSGNPTRGAFERALASVERGKFALAYASGLAATAGIINILKSNDHVICIDDVYGGTQRYFRQVCAGTMQLEFDFVDFSNVEKVKALITEKTKMIWLETPTNPTLKVTDIAAVSAAVHSVRKDIIVVVDNTFMSPYLQNPLIHGADIVMHSVTKYIGGHSDVLMGCLALNDESIYQRLKFIQNGMGGVPSPFEAYMALRGLKTLHVRMDCAMKNAMTIATYLESHSKVEKVIYPGLKSHPQYDIATKQASGYGAMITFFIKGGLTGAGNFLKTLELWTLAESLGAVESLAECPAVMTHASVPADKRAELGISDNLIRLSVGIEHIDDLLADIENALSKV